MSTAETDTDAWDRDDFLTGDEGSPDLWSFEAEGAPAAPYSMDPGLDGPPPWPAWLGTRWDDIAPEEKREAWIALRAWVDWFTRTYDMPVKAIKPCWYEHTEVVFELYGAMCAGMKTWAEPGPGFTALTLWHPQIRQLKDRLEGMAIGCDERSHRPDEPRTLQYDEQRWAAILNGSAATRSIPRESSVVWWRAGTIDGATRNAIYTEPVVVGPQPNPEPAAPTSLRVATKADPQNVVLTMNVESEHLGVFWERSTDQGDTWADAPPR